MDTDQQQQQDGNARMSVANTRANFHVTRMRVFTPAKVGETWHDQVPWAHAAYLSVEDSGESLRLCRLPMLGTSRRRCRRLTLAAARILASEALHYQAVIDVTLLNPISSDGATCLRVPGAAATQGRFVTGGDSSNCCGALPSRGI